MAPHLLIGRAAEFPDEWAIENVETGQASTYRELLDSVARWARVLAEQGVRTGDFVLSMLADQGDGIRSWLASAFVGAVEVPINPQHRGELLRAIVAKVAPRVVLVDQAVFQDIDAQDLCGADTIVVPGLEEPNHRSRRTLGPESFLTGAPSLERLPLFHDSDTATVVFTSGTTGASKGVLVSWAAAYQMVSWVPREAYGAGEGVYCPLPMFHLAGKSGLTNAFARRARFVYRRRFSASAFLDDVRSSNCAAASIVGPMLSVLDATPARPDDGQSPLRAVVCGPVIPGVEAFKRRFGVDVVTSYGMTEIGCVLTTPYGHGPWASCGRVRRDFPWPEVRIVDEYDRDVRPGAVGELVVRTPYPSAFSSGYLDDPDATAHAWRNGWFHSGDAFRTDDSGWFYLVDRFKDSLRRRGENVSSFEVEAVVGSYEGVVECAAVGVPGEHGDDDIFVFLIPTSPGAVCASDLREWVSRRLPSHMNPTEYRIVEELPRNSTTLRVMKYELRRMARDSDCGR